MWGKVRVHQPSNRGRSVGPDCPGVLGPTGSEDIAARPLSEKSGGGQFLFLGLSMGDHRGYLQPYKRVQGSRRISAQDREIGMVVDRASDYVTGQKEYQTTTNPYRFSR